MLLRTYLDRHHIGIKEAADELGEHYNTLRRWVEGERLPRPKAQEKIRTWSRGRVTPNDWHQQQIEAAA